MENQNIASGGDAPKVADQYVVAFYEGDTGRIRHVHTLTVFEGGQSFNESEAIRSAQHHAATAGHDTAQLKSIVSKNPEHGSRPHRIDIKTDTFVAIEMTRGSRPR